MKRAPIERTLAELPRGDRPPSARPLLPDIEPENDYAFAGPAALESVRLRAEIARLRRRVVELEADAAVLAVMAMERRKVVG